MLAARPAAVSKLCEHSGAFRVVLSSVLRQCVTAHVKRSPDAAPTAEPRRAEAAEAAPTTAEEDDEAVAERQRAGLEEEPGGRQIANAQRLRTAVAPTPQRAAPRGNGGIVWP